MYVIYFYPNFTNIKLILYRLLKYQMSELQQYS